jgi:hypothetical protein
MKKYSSLMVLIVVLFFSLALTVPTKSELVEHLSSVIENRINNKDLPEDPITQGVAKSLLKLIVDYSIDERDFLIFKQFTVSMRVPRAFGENIEDLKFIGIANQLIPLNKSVFSDGFASRKVVVDKSKSDDVAVNYPDITATVSSQYNLYDKSQVFVSELYNAISANNDVAIRVVDKYWASDVVYDGVKVNKDYLVNEKINFFQKWPLRNYVSNDQMLEIECQDFKKTCKLQGLVNWSLQSYDGRRRSKGSSEFTYVVDFSDQFPQILEESNRIVSSR